TRADARGDFNDPLAVDTFVDAASLLVNARVVVYQVFGPEPLSLRTLADSAATAGQISDDTERQGLRPEGLVDDDPRVHQERGRVDERVDGQRVVEVAARVRPGIRVRGRL